MPEFSIGSGGTGGPQGCIIPLLILCSLHQAWAWDIPVSLLPLATGKFTGLQSGKEGLGCARPGLPGLGQDTAQRVQEEVPCSPRVFFPGCSPRRRVCGTTAPGGSTRMCRAQAGLQRGSQERHIPVLTSLVVAP